MAGAVVESVAQETSSSRLLRASIRGDVDAVVQQSGEFCVKGLVDFETARTALHFVVLAGGTAGECAKVLLEAGCPADVVDVYGLTPLMLSYMYGAKAVTEALRTHLGPRTSGGPYSPQGMASWSNLMRSCQANRIGQIKHCLSSSDDVDAANQFGLTALHVAVHRGNALPVQMLLDAGCDVNVRDAFGWTPLMLACRLGNEDLTTGLLGCSADMQAVDCEGHSVLHTALLQGRTNILSCLMQYSPGVFGAHALPRSGCAPIQIATACMHEHVLRWFSEDNAPTTHSALNASLLMAIRLERFQMMRMLVALGATVQQGHVAAAVRQENADFCRYLIACGVNLTRSGKFTPESPLVLACHRSSIMCMRVLLEGGTRPNCRAGGGDLFDIPLAVALLNGGSAMVFELLRAGADPDLDRYCVTATGVVRRTEDRTVPRSPVRSVDSLPSDVAKSVGLCLQAGADYSRLCRLWYDGTGTDELSPLEGANACPSLQHQCVSSVWRHLARTLDHGDSFIHLQRATEQLPMPSVLRETLLFPCAMPGRSVLSQLCSIAQLPSAYDPG